MWTITYILFPGHAPTTEHLFEAQRGVALTYLRPDGYRTKGAAKTAATRAWRHAQAVVGCDAAWACVLTAVAP